jgi:hypothetical protein
MARAVAVNQKQLASAEAEKNRELFYSSDINLAQQAFETDNVERARDLLAAHKQNSGAFEWDYLNRLLHLEKETKLTAPDKGSTTIITSPDGKTLVLAANQKVELRNLETEETTPIIEIPDEKFSIGSMAISRDGKLLALGNLPKES